MEYTKPQRDQKLLAKFWVNLTEPSSLVKAPDERRRARLLANMAVALTVLTLIVTILAQVLSSDDSLTMLLLRIAAISIFIITYVLARSKHYAIGTVLLVVTTFWLIILRAFAVADNEAPAIILVAFLVGSILLSLRATVVLFALGIPVLWLLPAFIPELTFEGTYTSQLLVAVCAGILLIGLYHRNNLEADRQRKLRESEARIRAIVEAANDCIMITSEEGVIESCNPAVTEIFGYSPKEVLGKHINILAAEPHRSAINQYVRNYLETGKKKIIGSRLEVEGQHEDGTPFPLELSVSEIMVGETRSFVGIMRDLTERKKAENILEELASTDPLTSLFNRRKLNEFLEQEISRAKRYKTDFSVIMIDIDHFKNINDTYGHQEGDRVLKALGMRVKDTIRESDILARWGGEEFMILAVNTDLPNAQIVAEKIRTDIEIQHVADIVEFTVSVGVTQFKDSDDVASLVDRVDKALYQAKKEGRNRVKVAV